MYCIVSIMLITAFGVMDFINCLGAAIATSLWQPPCKKTHKVPYFF